MPVTYVMRFLQRRSERRFARAMMAAKRAMTWEDFELALREKRGTAIGEYLSLKGPFRLWWTEDDIPSVSPYNYDRGNHFAYWDSEYAPFFNWCRSVYTASGAGSAKLVQVPDGHRINLKAMLNGARFVSICSFNRTAMT